jgi:Ca2+-binding RTX toxin-like protein
MLGCINRKTSQLIDKETNMQTTLTVPHKGLLNTDIEIHRVTYAQAHDFSASWWGIDQGSFTETHYFGTAGNDLMQGNSPDLNIFYPGLGNDHIIGSAGRDLMYGEAGNDRLEGHGGNDRLWAGRGNDQLLGGTGDDQLFGMHGNDYLEGGSGNDKLDGGEGNDMLIGGAGRDTFSWGFFTEDQRGSSDIDIVSDFTPGEDKLQFGRLLDEENALRLSLRQEGNSGVIELHDLNEVLVQTVVLKNTDLLSVRDEFGTLSETLSSQAALQRLTDMGALEY